MTILRNLSAYTPPGGSYPPFISINETERGVAFSIRTRAKPVDAEHPYPRWGDQAHIVLERSLAVRVLTEALERLRDGESE